MIAFDDALSIYGNPYKLSSFKLKLLSATICFSMSIYFFWAREQYGYDKAQKAKLVTEEQCAELTQSTLGHWIACLAVHGVSKCILTYKTRDHFEDKGCLRYLNEKKATFAESNNTTSSAICADDEC